MERLVIKDKNRKIDFELDLPGLEKVIKEAAEFVPFGREEFYEQVNRVLRGDGKGDDILSDLNRLRAALNGNKAIVDLDSFKEGVTRIIDSLDYISDLFARRGLFLTAARLGEAKLKIPTPYEFSISGQSKEIALCRASRRMEVGKDYFISGMNVPKENYFKKAKDYFKESLSGFKKYEENELAGQMHLGLAIIYDLLGEESKSDGHFKGAISEFNNLGFDLSDQSKGMLKRAALIEIAASLMGVFRGKEDGEPGRRHRLEFALSNFRKAEPDHLASFIHFLALTEIRGGYDWIKKRLLPAPASTP